MSSISDNTFTPEAEADLRESLKRCRPEIIEAAVHYRRTRDPKEAPKIVLGIIERFLEPEMRSKLQVEDCDDLRMIDDLGVDSLIMVEIVMTIEETLKLSIPDEELRGLQSVKDVKDYISQKIKGSA
ncbi:MAG: acyl carrier protein [Verrucomicrobia bacterium CG_4_10_14_3_um_filter_43_23]|nr:MAG: 3-hydroxyacyl-ACP dehydratase [Verrucomicrobia bacterium CG22_combo_CG10-13_8_21_14_all_43_17]PIX58995.1 MAG: acyl carrier protein [Verrucomicrobia bacterium CG_4_10_14_3_um_filter_43_23]PIY63116.1 MAG: acyl carrier protein [Verrucomicrobia bacterium CG_4_10_14_0_8_um_filter_43_34]PJA43624.1 MAG: acyl carrier protein [Verrucomicrobia bacterium CG_4_9_14_3_um_filter_43_20]